MLLTSVRPVADGRRSLLAVVGLQARYPAGELLVQRACTVVPCFILADTSPAMGGEIQSALLPCPDQIYAVGSDSVWLPAALRLVLCLMGCTTRARQSMVAWAIGKR